MCLGSEGELPEAKANTTSPRSSGEISRGSHQGCFTEEKLRVLGFWGSAGRCYVTGKTCQAGGPDDHKRSQATCWEQRHGLTEATHRTSAHRNPHSSVSWPLEINTNTLLMHVSYFQAHHKDRSTSIFGSPKASLTEP